MTFSDLLNIYISERGIRSCDICTGIGVKKAWLSKLRSGLILPPDWNVIRRLSHFLQLTDDEYGALSEAYRAACLPPDMLAADRAMRRLHAFRGVLPEAPVRPQCTALPENGALLTDRGAQEALLALVQHAKSVHIIGLPEEGEFRTALYHALSQTDAACQLQWLILLDSSGFAAEPLNRMTDLLPVLLRHPAEVRCIRADEAQYRQHTLFPLLISADAGVLLLSADCQKALFFSGDAANVYREFLKKQFTLAAPLMQMHNSLQSFLAGWRVDSAGSAEEVYSFSESPSLAFSATRDEVQSHMVDESLFDPFLQLLQNLYAGVGAIHDFFWESGIRKILSGGEYYEYGKSLSASIPPPRRRTLLCSCVAEARSAAALDYGVVRTVFPAQTDFFGMNFWSGGRMFLLLNPDGQFGIVTAHEPRTVQALIRWTEIMRKHGLITAKNEAIEICETALGETQQ